jgi:aminopeptidase N
LRIDYAGNLVGYTEIGWLYVRDRIDTAFTIIREDALAFPAIGGQSFAAWRQMPPRSFTYDVSVRVPRNLVVAAGGTETRRTHNDGTATWRYVTRTPAPFVNIAVAPFDTLITDGVRLSYFKGDSIGAQRVMASAQAALRLLREWFGPLRGTPNLTITEIPDGWGSQADLTAGIIQTAAAFRNPGQLGELYHELAHLWNVPDVDSPSPRWNEGYATFMQDLLREHVDGWTGRKEAQSHAIAAMNRAIAADSSLRAIPMADYGRRDMTGRSYRVGALMFATLYELLGAADFNRVIGGYYRQFEQGGNTRAFVDFVSATTQRDLSRFFDDWVFTTRWVHALARTTSVVELASQYRVTARWGHARGRAKVTVVPVRSAEVAPPRGDHSP